LLAFIQLPTEIDCGYNFTEAAGTEGLAGKNLS
jgi:hypothetical protein